MSPEAVALGRTARARDLAAADAAEADRRGTLDDQVVAAIQEAGFPRYFVPAERGGRGGTFAQLVVDVAQVGAGCPAAAWYASLSAAVGRMAAFLPAPGQDAVWAQGPDVLLAGALVPSGRAEAAPGGWRLSGRWPYVSAVEHAGWSLLHGLPAPGSSPGTRFFAVPRNSYTILPTWSSVGMRATASNTVELVDVLVPDALTFPARDLVEGRQPGPGGDHRLAVPLRAVNGLTFAAPALGAARGAERACWDELGAGLAGETADAAAFDQEQSLARGGGQIDAAELLLDRAARVADGVGGGVSTGLTLRSARDCALAADLLVDAVDRFARAAGTRGQHEHSPIQRFARDVRTAATHTMLRFTPAASALVRHLAAAG